MPDNQGGPRTPNRPAAVSGPGALSQRTDGGPGAKQPIRVPTGGAYGERQAAVSQQEGAPLATGGPGPAGRPGGTSTPAPPAGPGGFGPTQRPGELITAGNPAPDTIAGAPAQQVLRAIYEQYPSPWIAGLLDDN